MAGSEKMYEARVRACLRMKAASWHIKYWGGGLHTTSGVPDVLACVEGVFVGIEVKARNGRPTLLQLKQLELIRKACGRGILLYPDDFNDFREWLYHRCNFSKWYSENIKMQTEWMKKLENQNDD